MTKEDLQEVREWADLQIASAELPSTWYQLMKLREALDAILYGLDIAPVILPEDLSLATRDSGGHLRLVGTDERDGPQSD